MFDLAGNTFGGDTTLIKTLVSFLDFDLGFFDHQQDRVEPAPNPFAPVRV